ncbi:MAG: hypothetical protein R2815_07805 [Flavobacteriales bacterium]
MEPKYLTLIQAAAIALVLSLVVVTRDPAPVKGTTDTEFAVTH